MLRVLQTSVPSSERIARPKTGAGAKAQLRRKHQVTAYARLTGAPLTLPDCRGSVRGFRNERLVTGH